VNKLQAKVALVTAQPRTGRRHIVLALVGMVGLGPWASRTRAASHDAAALLPVLRAGATLLMRHTQTTPGVGDPPGWKLGQCWTQRNLAPEGIEHAKRIGQWFADQGLRVAQVRNSPWCRTRDTARLAFGRTSDWTAISNIFDDRAHADAKAAEVHRAVQSAPPGELHVWVSHGVLIAHVLATAGIGGSPLAPGEAVVLRGGAQAGQPLQVLGLLRVP
jgi:phosphohistidine phosphatase SixA